MDDKPLPSWLSASVGIGAVVVLAVFLFLSLSAKQTPPSSLSSIPVVGIGGSCGGFIRGAGVCAAGLHCQINTHRPDTGGVCVADTASSTGSTGNNAGGIAPFHSGIRGVVVLGPTCPVAHNLPSAGCADSPYQTVVTVSRASSPKTFATQAERTNAAGAFSFSLPPGTYTLTAKGGTPFSRCSSVNVTVNPTSYATTTISCDTGIR